MRKIALALCAAPLALAVASSADAQVTIFTDQALFLAAISAPGVDRFESLPLHGYIGSPITRTAGAYGYTATAANGLYGEGMGADRWLSTNTFDNPIVLSGFTGGVFGIGGLFFGSDVNGAFSAGGNLNFTVTDAGGEYAYALSNATLNSFVGFVSTTGITGLSISVADVNSGWPAVSTLTLGSASIAPGVPEPATWGLMIIGFGAVGGMMRRKSVTKTRVRFT